MVGTDTYDLKELAKLLGWNPGSLQSDPQTARCRPDGEIDDETAAKVAQKIRRPWPPKAA